MKCRKEYLVMIYVASVIVRFNSCSEFALHHLDTRMSNISEGKMVLSLLDCAVMAENSNALSFSFHPDNKTCGISNMYPEGVTIDAVGWNTFYKIVDGAWSDWTSWSSCADPFNGERTRTRNCSNPAPGVGGKSCSGMSVLSRPCYLTCFDDSNLCVSEVNATWTTAKFECEAANATLVIFENLEEIDYLATKIDVFQHWIGMTCDNNLNCVWINGSVVDGTSVNAWAPGEPKYGGCVWIGYYGDKFDDTDCGYIYPFICKYKDDLKDS